jgi:hypothetical protein
MEADVDGGRRRWLPAVGKRTFDFHFGGHCVCDTCGLCQPHLPRLKRPCLCLVPALLVVTCPGPHPPPDVSIAIVLDLASIYLIPGLATRESLSLIFDLSLIVLELLFACRTEPQIMQRIVKSSNFKEAFTRGNV